MNQIKLKRGSREVIFTKVPDRFAVHLKQGRAKDDLALEAACGKPKTSVTHLDYAEPDNMDIFVVREEVKLEETMDDLRKAPSSDIVTHIYALDNLPGSEIIPTGTLTIQFKTEEGNTERENILAEFGLEILEELDFLSQGYTVRLTESSKENPLKIALKLQQRKEIETAEPNISFQISQKHLPVDSLYQYQWHLENKGGMAGLTAGADVKAEEAWNITRGSRDIVVCVMDDGFDLDHPDFTASGKIVSPRDFGQNDFDPNPVSESDNHGTACAGVALAEENGVGVVGLAPRCSFMPIRTSGWLSDNSITNLFKYAIDNNADVISCSWSARAWDFPLSTIMHEIIKKTATQGRNNNKGCVILFAAGNESRPLDGTINGQVSYQGFALHPNVIAVAASNSLDKQSNYSNFGPELTICAPSSGSPGRRIVTTDRRGINGYSTGDYTSGFGGTSSSTPLTAGLAALILSVNPELPSAQVKKIMMATADKIDQANGQYVNGHSSLYGHGRINAYKAVKLAAGTGDENMLEVLFMEHRINKPIPDKGSIEDSITFPLNVIINEIEVDVEIKHTYRGDLKVGLRSPNGTEIILVNRTGGSADDIVKSFRSSDDPSLFTNILNSSAQGDWSLKIEDLASQDVGVLAKWGLAITY